MITMTMFRRSAGLLFAFLIAVSALYGADGIHTIGTISFEIDGNTRETALRNFLDIAEGDSFGSREEILTAFEEAKQDLLNYRVFESVGLESKIVSETDEETVWDVRFSVVDAWTLLPIPYPKYSTNTGFRFAVRTDYDNAFGTMTDIYVNMGLNVRTNSDTGDLEVSQWNISPEWGNIRLGRITTLTVVTEQSLKENSYDSGSAPTQYWYSYYRTLLGTDFHFNLPGRWSYYAKPTFSFRYGYRDVKGWGNFYEEPFVFAVNHGTGWGRVNWSDNFRKGQSYSASHTISFTFDPESGKRVVENELAASGRWYLPFLTIFDYYGRTGGFVVFNGTKSGAGSYLRGVADNQVSGTSGWYMNNTLAIRFWRWPGVWDVQIQPFVDMGIVAPENGFDLSNDFHLGAGMDVVLYVDKLPSLVARGSLGLNLSDSSLSGFEKLEIDITSELAY